MFRPRAVIIRLALEYFKMNIIYLLRDSNQQLPKYGSRALPGPHPAQYCCLVDRSAPVSCVHFSGHMALNYVWGCACKSNIAVIERCQSKILRAIVDAPWYVTNDMIHKDLGIPTVHEVIHARSMKHRTKLESHSNPLLQPLPRDNGPSYEITSYEDCKDGGQLTCNTVNEIFSLEGASSG